MRVSNLAPKKYIFLKSCGKDWSHSDCDRWGIALLFLARCLPVKRQSFGEGDIERRGCERLIATWTRRSAARVRNEKAKEESLRFSTAQS
jgi:hypothetical protein